MITEKNNFFYCDCGFSFQRCRSGAHDCADGLRNKLAESEARCAALAAENGQMLRLLTDISENHDEYVNQDEYLYAGMPMDYVSEINAYVSRDVDADNPFKETDAYLAEVRAQAHKEGAHFVANRMLAAWEAGFIDDTAKNAADIARMILTSTEFMADAPEGDFDRSFADGVLEDIAAQLRKGVQS
ncbi:ead/Ea22-like family protein [Enterobacter roggenkampii]|uniref:ead/Ea22-like family protein n=1 Tax=Enterobacter roggenkampii TaxID=1812935 RepID=UPI001EF81DF4|nr:ead/Ea22-like family protein [Enterobacter roggenkampii]